MAIKLSDQYPGRAEPPSIDYPLGAFKNRSAPQVLDGTPLDKGWANDKEGFFQSILADAEITADGQPDKVGASQYLDALKKIISDSAPSQATELESGVAKIATQSSSLDFLNNTDIITPARLASSLKLRVGHSFLENDWAPLPGGLIVQWGNISGIGANTPISITMPIAFPSSTLSIATSMVTTSVSSLGILVINSVTKTGFSIQQSGGAVSVGAKWIAIGI